MSGRIGFKSLNGGNWKAVCKDAAGETEVDTGFFFDGRYHNLSFQTDAVSVIFSIDDQVVAQIKTNIPTQLLRATGFVKTTDASQKDFGIDNMSANSPR